MEILAAALVGFAVDLLLGDPAWMPHLVVYMGKAISFLEKRLRPAFPNTPRGQIAAGAVLAAALPLGTRTRRCALRSRRCGAGRRWPQSACGTRAATSAGR